MARARRVVVKVGSSSARPTPGEGRLDEDRLVALVDVLAKRRLAGQQVVLVSSGAIAAGIAPLGLAKRPWDLATQQAAASVGQGALVAAYQRAFGAHGLTVGQVLLTADDVTRRSHYTNARRTLDRLLELGIVPIVNENDTVATQEIRFGDNDRLASLVAHLVHADGLVLLTDVDALYDGPPQRPGATRVPFVVGGAGLEQLDHRRHRVERRQRRHGHQGRGRLDRQRRRHHHAADQRRPGRGGPRGSRRRHGLHPHGLAPHLAQAVAGARDHADGSAACSTPARCGPSPSAAPRCCRRASPASRAPSPTATPSTCARPRGRVIGRGLVNYTSAELPGMLGRSTRELAKELGPEYEREVVHRDDLVIL